MADSLPEEEVAAVGDMGDSGIVDFSPEEKSPAKEASKNHELEVNSNS